MGPPTGQLLIVHAHSVRAIRALKGLTAIPVDLVVPAIRALKVLTETLAAPAVLAIRALKVPMAIRATRAILTILILKVRVILATLVILILILKVRVILAIRVTPILILKVRVILATLMAIRVTLTTLILKVRVILAIRAIPIALAPKTLAIRARLETPATLVIPIILAHKTRRGLQILAILVPRGLTGTPAILVILAILKAPMAIPVILTIPALNPLMAIPILHKGTTRPATPMGRGVHSIRGKMGVIQVRAFLVRMVLAAIQVRVFQAHNFLAAIPAIRGRVFRAIPVRIVLAVIPAIRGKVTLVRMVLAVIRGRVIPVRKVLMDILIRATLAIPAHMARLAIPAQVIPAFKATL